MCIYYGENKLLTYNKQEHVFLAGLGGIAMLPKGVVSDQANELFSPLEYIFMHNSLISTTRRLFGPGKRGKLSVKNVLKSSKTIVSGFDGKHWSLSFTALGTPYIIPYFWRNKKDVLFSVPPTKKYNEAMMKFIEDLKKFTTYYVNIENKDLPDDNILIGFYDNKYYVCSNKKLSVEVIFKEIHFAIKVFKLEKVKDHQSQVKQKYQLIEDIDTRKIYAKTLINVLAYLKGVDYLKQKCFDEIIDWIINDNNYKNFISLPNIGLSNKFCFPEKSHWCIITPMTNSLLCIICFYGAYFQRYKINSIDNQDTMPFGYICDWENRKQYSLLDWVEKITNLNC